MNAYAYKRDFSYPVEAARGKQELDRIREKYQINIIKPEHIVDESRSENAVLHRVFEWNDSIAGEKYRYIQAGNYIRAIIEVTPDDKQVRAFHNVIIRTESSSNRGYVPIEVVRDDQVLYSQVLTQALQEFLNLKNKYEHLKELNPILEVIQNFEIPEKE